MFDLTISTVFHDPKRNKLLSMAKITKPCGIDTIIIVHDFYTIPFLMIN